MLRTRSAVARVQAIGETLPEATVELKGFSREKPAPIEKVKDEYRYQIWYFCARATEVVPKLVRLQAGFAWPADVTQVLDVDPMSLV